MKTKILLLSCMLTSALASISQTTLCNREWETITALPDTVDLTMSAIDNTGCAIITGNTKTIAQGTNLLLVKYNGNGSICWQQQYNGAANGSDFGSAVVQDNSGNIYVTGATWGGNVNGYDFVTLKYNSSGILQWSVLYNGTGSKNDIPSRIAVDNAGNVYVTGASIGTGNALNSDYATIKYTASGAQVWVKRYNYINLPDIPVGLVVDNSGNVFVGGTSASSFFNSDFAVIKYNAAGTQVGVYRHTVPGNGYDKATAIRLDNNGNVFLSGAVLQGSPTSDFALVKLSNVLSFQWVQYYDGESLDDCANALEVDAWGDPVVTGWTKKQNGGKDFTTIRYSGTGALQWIRREAAAISSNFGEAHTLAIDNNGDVFVSGEMTSALGNKDFLTIKYTSGGIKEWQNFFNNPFNAGDKSYTLSMRNNILYACGKSCTGANDQYATVKYSFLNAPLLADTTVPGTAPFAKGEVIVRFDPISVIPTKVNDKDIQFGYVHEFITPAAIAVMNNKLHTDVTDWRIAKIFLDLTTLDTISISRTNDTVPIPTFWAAFRIFTSGMPDQVVADSLNHCQPELWYAHLNFIVATQNVPNDNEYNLNQGSLHPTTLYPGGHINMEPAWDIERGNSNIRVGIYDTGIDQLHPELQGRVVGGYNYSTNTALSTPYDNFGHGTSCAGIVGAKRNNSAGIAGIAGGDGTPLFDGVQLFDMHILEPNATVSLICNAITGGATSVAQGGFGLNIMSNSWAAGVGACQACFNQQEISLMKDAVRYAARNKVVFAASRGNDGNTDLLFPACYPDEFVLNVGATGTNGEYKDLSNGDPYSSSYDGGIDFCAPGTTQLVYTTESGTGSYHTFNGTSAACPHVAGTAALMLSQNNTPSIPFLFHLQPEDVEHILQGTATDLTGGSASPGYDAYTGYGRINAGSALDETDYPKYKVYHYGTAENSTGYVITPSLYLSGVSVILPNSYQSVAAGIYEADIHKVTHTINFTPIPGNEVILGIWPRYNSSFGWSLANPLGTEAWSNIVSFTNGQVIMETYFYHFTQNSTTQQTMNLYLPSTQFGTKAAISIMTYDPNAVGVAENSEPGFTISEPFPNPANDNVNLYVTLQDHTSVTVDLFDMEGRLVKTQQEGELPAGVHLIEMQTAEISEGVYFMKVTTGKGTLPKKILIVH